MDERTTVDCVANARALAPVLAAAAPRIESGRELPPDLVERAARGAHVSHAGAALARRRGDFPGRLCASHRRTRQGRCLDGVVHRPDLGLLDDLQEHAAANRRGDFQEKSARRAGLGRLDPQQCQGRRRKGRLPGHRRLAVCQRQPARHLARRPLLHRRAERRSRAAMPTAIRCRKPWWCRASARRSTTSGT